METKELIQQVIEKSSLKQEVFHNTRNAFGQFRSITNNFISVNRSRVTKSKFPLLFEFTDRGDFEFQLKFGSDILIFFMHSNVFEIPRDHLLMKSSYIKDDKSRSYCGIIHVYNFLADSFRYNRENDRGYCICRIFVNRENHYFIEGKREIAMHYVNFENSRLGQKEMTEILHGAILYSLNFDLLTPPFDSVKEITVAEMLSALNAMSISTGKRLGFKFQADEI